MCLTPCPAIRTRPRARPHERPEVRHPLPHGPARPHLPIGVCAKAFLKEYSFHVDDQVLGSRRPVDDFEAVQGVDTTPQVFIAGKRIGGCDTLEQYLAG